MQKRIRSVEIGDAPVIRDIYAPYVTDSAISFEIEPPDVRTIEQRIRSVQEQYPWLVFEVYGQVVGYAYASRHRERPAYQWSVDVSVYIHTSGHRRGIGRALYTSLFEILRRQGYVSAYAGITLPNPSSVGLHESVGFLPVGVFTKVGYKFGKWYDVIWLQLRLLDSDVPIPIPLSAKQVLSNRDILRILEQQAWTVTV